MLIGNKKNFSPILVLLVLTGFLSGCISAKAPKTEPAAPAVVAGPVDSDNDGVYDDQDACPNTRPGAIVDEKGCEIILRLPSANFDFDKSELKAEAIPALTQAAQHIATRGINRIEIAGHTDSQGSDSYNMKLGQERADSVLQFFIEQGLNPTIFSAISYGESSPIANNETEQGRASNRRVEIIDLTAQ